MDESYKFEMLLLDTAFKLDQISEENYICLLGMLLDADGEDLYQLEIINDDLAQALADHKKQKISDRLVKGAELIESTPDPKEKARLMVHYNNLLKELGA